MSDPVEATQWWNTTAYASAAEEFKDLLFGEKSKTKLLHGLGIACEISSPAIPTLDEFHHPFLYMHCFVS